MKDKIEVGEYIRTKEGIIRKVEYVEGISKPYVIKHSKNIIDLIEEGDYVNGERIAEKFYDYANKEYHLVTKANKHYFLNDIKTIVTKEQFKEMEYRV